MIHKNSLKARKELKPGGTHNRILQLFHIVGRPMTDREVKILGKYGDLNEVRPRIKNLIDMGRLEEVDSVLDATTKKTVRRTRLVLQRELF